jgi:dTDP-4-dehydrorhamnose reductase
MINYIVLGYKGMLGRYMLRHLGKSPNHVVAIGREQIDADNAAPLDIRETLLSADCLSGDIVVVNCIGMIKPQVDKYGVERAIEVNSIFPRLLADVCQSLQFPLIHVTTDCVFSGRRGKYTETDAHDALDVYGKTKSLGEPDNCTVIRTSIIGEEVGQTRSLVEWIKSSAGKTVNGFTNHLWNGVTCLQLAKVVEQIVEIENCWQGVRHVYSPTDVTKLELVNLVSDTYNLGISVTPTEAKEPCDRTLRSNFPLLQIPELSEQIKEMKDFKLV